MLHPIVPAPNLETRPGPVTALTLVKDGSLRPHRVCHLLHAMEFALGEVLVLCHPLHQQKGHGHMYIVHPRLSIVSNCPLSRYLFAAMLLLNLFKHKCIV